MIVETKARKEWTLVLVMGLLLGGGPAHLLAQNDGDSSPAINNSPSSDPAADSQNVPQVPVLPAYPGSPGIYGTAVVPLEGGGYRIAPDVRGIQGIQNPVQNPPGNLQDAAGVLPAIDSWPPPPPKLGPGAPPVDSGGANVIRYQGGGRNTVGRGLVLPEGVRPSAGAALNVPDGTGGLSTGGVYRPGPALPTAPTQPEGTVSMSTLTGDSGAPEEITTSILDFFRFKKERSNRAVAARATVLLYPDRIRLETGDTFRPFGVIIPEDEVIQDRARRFIREQVLGKRVRVTFEEQLGPSDDPSTLGHGYIELPSGRLLNLELIRRGLGMIDPDLGTFTWYREYADAEDRARRENRGLWARRQARSGAGE